ncbi:unnamed protein product [Allacma fusca]|uniref:R3H domain-containing protein n=1 Tax=Allacma fusca TaxID=39272 RepID=A0A8J2LIL9_9HEXA|nr:unnamed protein product [Allacma fusca]
MKKMEKPPGLDEKDKLRLKQQREMMQKQREDEQRRIRKFRETLEEKMKTFSSDDSQDRLILEPMNKPQRAIVHDMAETAGLVALSFGQEEIDRHVILFKGHTAPCEDEVIAMRRGEVYDPDAKKLAPSDDQQDDAAPSEEPTKGKPRRGRHDESKPEYLQKYEKHLGGLAVAKDAARATGTNRSYGFVSSEQKKDKRTIEQTLADIRAKKKQRIDEENNKNN